MRIVTEIKEVREQIKKWRREGLSIGLVPTMGYLHAGHRSLMERAALENDRVVASIFVNPMQFGPNEDLEAYPRDLERDAALCEKAGVSLIFHPEPEELYHPDFATYTDVRGLTEGLCGKTRPTHFRGVCTVVSKLFHIVAPDRAYFGQKDAQQLAVIRRMTEDMNFDLEIVGCPIVREADGLAMSSRNIYLTPEERSQALCLSRSLQEAQAMFAAGERDPEVIKAGVTEIIRMQPLADIDYVELVDDRSLQPVEGSIRRPALLALAVRFGRARLIDNCVLGDA